MQCVTPIHAHTWLHACYHVVDQRVLDSVWPYFNTSIGKKNNLSDPHGPLAQSVPSTSIAAANSFLSGTQVVPQVHHLYTTW